MRHSAMIGSLIASLGAFGFGTSKEMRRSAAVDNPVRFRVARYYIVSTRQDHGGAKPHCGKRRKHTSRAKSAKRARCRAKRRAA